MNGTNNVSSGTETTTTNTNTQYVLKPPPHDDELSIQLREEALETLQVEPELCALLHRTVLAPGVSTFEDAVSSTVCYRMLLQNPCPKLVGGTSAGTATSTAAMTSLGGGGSQSQQSPMFCPSKMKSILDSAMSSTKYLEMGHTMSYAIRQDANAIIQRDPAIDTLLEVVLFSKGYAAVVCHRAARYKWYETIELSKSLSSKSKQGKQRKSFTALFLQSQASAVFALDIHPAATLGAGIMLDHGTGIVIGETAHLGDGCTLLHGVTLGGTGKDSGDRHPKVGANVLIGANASILGNIKIGKGAKIGAGSIVLRDIPAGATAVGAPAKIIGHAKESNPGSDMDETLQRVSLLHKSTTVTTLSTTNNAKVNAKTAAAAAEDNNDEDNNDEEDSGRPLTMDNDDDDDDNGSKSVPPMALPLSDASSSTSSSDYDSGSDSGGSRSGSTSRIDNCCCPFRDYVKLAKMAPPGSITILNLIKLLKPLGCTTSQIQNVFFQLDTRDVGYFYYYDTKTATAASDGDGDGGNGNDHHDIEKTQVIQAIAEHTSLSESEAKEMVERNCTKGKRATTTTTTAAGQQQQS